MNSMARSAPLNRLFSNLFEISSEKWYLHLNINFQNLSAKEDHVKAWSGDVLNFRIIEQAKRFVKNSTSIYCGLPLNLTMNLAYWHPDDGIFQGVNKQAVISIESSPENGEEKYRLIIFDNKLEVEKRKEFGMSRSEFHLLQQTLISCFSSLSLEQDQQRYQINSLYKTIHQHHAPSFQNRSQPINFDILNDLQTSHKY